MNPQIEKQISELLELVKNGAESLPPYLSQLAEQSVTSVLIKSVSGLTFATLCLGVAFPLAFKARKVFKKARDKKDPDYERIDFDDFVPWAFSAGCAALAGGLVMFLSGEQLLRCVYCPDLVAFQKLTEMLR